MEVKEILKRLREQHGMTQEQFAQRLHITRQGVSRWETGETQPNTEMLKQISREFDVSIDTLLGVPRAPICQCCGMPLEDQTLLSREPDGAVNADYCKWCYAGGQFTYATKDKLIDFMVAHMPNPQNLPPKELRALYDQHLSQLGYWKSLQT